MHPNRTFKTARELHDAVGEFGPVRVLNGEGAGWEQSFSSKTFSWYDNLLSPITMLPAGRCGVLARGKNFFIPLNDNHSRFMKCANPGKTFLVTQRLLGGIAGLP